MIETTTIDGKLFRTYEIIDADTFTKEPILGAHPIKDPKTGNEVIQHIPYQVYWEIIDVGKKKYWEKIKRDFENGVIGQIKVRFYHSTDHKELYSRQIAACQYLMKQRTENDFDLEDLEILPERLRFYKGIGVEGVRKAYKKYVVNGERNYWDFGYASIQIGVDLLNLYYEQLKKDYEIDYNEKLEPVVNQIEAIDFVIGAIDEKEPLKFTHKYLAYFSILLMSIKREKYMLNDKAIYLIRRLFDINHEAIQSHLEMKQYFFQNGEGVERALKYLHKDLIKIDQQFDEIKENNPIIKAAIGLNKKECSEYFKSVAYHGQEQFDSYCEAKDYFDLFYSNFLEITDADSSQKGNKTREIFPHDNLKLIFYPKAIEAFKEIEIGFLTDGWIVDKTWQKEKNMLVSLILLLQNRGYLKKINAKSDSTCRLEYRRFFENRYNVKIQEQMKPSKIKKFNLPKAFEPSFQFIKCI